MFFLRQNVLVISTWITCLLFNSKVKRVNKRFEGDSKGIPQFAEIGLLLAFKKCAATAAMSAPGSWSGLIISWAWEKMVRDKKQKLDELRKGQ